MFEIVLYQPQIAPNTGNIIRLCANSGCKLHLIEPLGFSMDHKQLRRAGLDYHALAEVQRWQNWAQFRRHYGGRLVSFSTRNSICYSDFCYQPGDALLFGAETSGLPEEVQAEIVACNKLHIPMREANQNRSLNLSNSVAIVMYEAWRQWDFAS